MKRILLTLLCIPLFAPAQLQLYVAPQGGQEQAVTAIYDLGTGYAGEALSTRFRIRNTGTTSTVLSTLYVSGAGFSMTGAPSLPFTIAPGLNVDFTVHFRAADYGFYSANLQVNGVGVLLRANGSAVASFYIEGQPVPSGSTVDFGRVERGSQTSMLFEARNTTREPVAVSRIDISGGPFTFPAGNPGPIYLEPGASVQFRIQFAPNAAGIATGSVTIDRDRVILFTGTGIEPPMQRPMLTVEPAVLRSGEQGRVSVGFAQPSRARGKGQLRVQLRPSDGAKDNDATVSFLSGSRSAVFDVVEAQRAVVFEETRRTDVTFQAGTTAGTLIFIVEAGGFTEQISVPITAEPVRLDKAGANRNGSTLEVSLAGFDNTRTASEISFTFLNASGQPVAGSPVRVNAAADFGRWWESSTYGGTFALRAAFPVSGDASAVKSVEVQFVNSAGTTKTDRLAF